MNAQYEMAARAALETLIACAGVTREQLKRWMVTFQKDALSITFTFRNYTSSRRMEVEVFSNFEAIENGIKVSTCITLIAQHGQVTRPNTYVDVLLPPIQKKVNQRVQFQKFRRHAA